MGVSKADRTTKTSETFKALFLIIIGLHNTCSGEVEWYGVFPTLWEHGGYGGVRTQFPTLYIFIPLHHSKSKALDKTWINAQIDQWYDFISCHSSGHSHHFGQLLPRFAEIRSAQPTIQVVFEHIKNGRSDCLTRTSPLEVASILTIKS